MGDDAPSRLYIQMDDGSFQELKEVTIDDYGATRAPEADCSYIYQDIRANEMRMEFTVRYKSRSMWNQLIGWHASGPYRGRAITDAYREMEKAWKRMIRLARRAATT